MVEFRYQGRVVFTDYGALAVNETEAETRAKLRLYNLVNSSPVTWWSWPLCSTLEVSAQIRDIYDNPE